MFFDEDLASFVVQPSSDFQPAFKHMELSPDQLNMFY